MADTERLLEHDQYRTEQVRQAVAGGKCHGEAVDTQPGEHRIGREPQLIGPLYQQPDRDLLGQRTDTMGEFWLFDASGLRLSTTYRLALAGAGDSYFANRGR
jgi:hypothetical protein